MDEPEIVERAKDLFKAHINESLTLDIDKWVLSKDITVEWAAEIFGDWRVCMSIPQVYGRKFVLIYDSDKQEEYIIAYEAWIEV